jgi:putative two-component system response regulator
MSPTFSLPVVVELQRPSAFAPFLGPAAMTGVDDEPSPATSERCFDPAAWAQMERMVEDLGRMYRERNEALQEVARAHHDALFRLALAAEYRDDDTGQHIVRMGFLAEALSLATGSDARYAAMLRKAAPMHDVGKIGIPDAVLKKPGRFNAQERQVMNQHPMLGAAILGQSRIPLFQLAAEVALSHHERWDGSGYPAGRRGLEIPLSGRIVAIVDFFDALTMDRCYRPAFSDEQALAMLTEERGRAFDPDLVDLFLSRAGRMITLRDRINRLQPSFAELADGVDLR